MRKLSRLEIRAFRSTLYSHFRLHGRSLPWRKTKDPYLILVSEIQLQQTQVDRVIVKYQQFLKTFPTLQVLANAPLSKVLWTWSGLGYNRRAVALKRSAEVIVAKHKGHVPQTLEELDALPGIGYHTAGAIMAFAYNKPVVFIETNIRSVFIHHFFSKRKNVRDNELVPLITQTLDQKNPRKWYSALMDYGASLKKQVENPSRRSAHHTVQSGFEGSNRQLRGRVLKALLAGPYTAPQLQRLLKIEISILKPTLVQLQHEGLVRTRKGLFVL